MDQINKISFSKTTELQISLTYPSAYNRIVEAKHGATKTNFQKILEITVSDNNEDTKSTD